jgi:hypothetical protein
MEKKEKEKLKACKLRKRGLSLNKISDHLKVSKGSVSVWVKDIKLTNAQKNILRLNSSLLNPLKGAKVQKASFKLRQIHQKNGRMLARKNIPLHIAGCMLIWCEGGKRRNTVELSNSNIHMLKLFMKFLKKFYHVNKSAMIININAHDTNNIPIKKIEEYWVRGLELSKKNLRKTILNHYSHFSQRKKIGKLPYGTCRLCVHRTDIAQNIYGAIQEYGQFKNDSWA